MSQTVLQTSSSQAFHAPPPSRGLIGKNIPQTTLKKPIHCQGVGLHTGRNTYLRISPAAANTGICFQRLDLPSSPLFRVQYDTVVQTRLSTVIAPPGQPDASVATIEHFMAALHALNVDNACVQLNGPEIPALDGCADDFVFLLQCAGLIELDAPRQKIEILRPIYVEAENGAWGRLSPNRKATLSLDVTIDFPSPVIGRQHYHCLLTAQNFQREIAPARTFINHDAIATLQAQGLALGGSLKNALVVDGKKVLNPQGLRYQDEFVRHKLLDAIGDLYCAGYSFIGHFEGLKCGHNLNNRLLHAVFAQSENWRLVTAKRGLAQSFQQIAA